MHQYPHLMLMYRRKTKTKVLITYSFSSYLIVSSTDLFESSQFLKSNCAHKCMELFGITLVAVFQKHPGTAPVSWQGEFKSWCLELLIFTNSSTESILQEFLELKSYELQECAQIKYNVSE